MALEEIMKWYSNTHVGREMCYLTLTLHVILDGEWIFLKYTCEQLSITSLQH